MLFGIIGNLNHPVLEEKKWSCEKSDRITPVCATSRLFTEATLDAAAGTGNKYGYRYRKEYRPSHKENHSDKKLGLTFPKEKNKFRGWWLCALLFPCHLNHVWIVFAFPFFQNLQPSRLQQRRIVLGKSIECAEGYCDRFPALDFPRMGKGSPSTEQGRRLGKDLAQRKAFRKHKRSFRCSTLYR